MKRNFKLLVALVALCAMVLTLASCDVIQGLINPQTHEHQYSAEWSHDDTNHWHAATCQDGEACASAKADVAAHNFVNGTCECGAKVPKCADDNHQYSSETVKEATCTEDGEKKFTCSKCGDSFTQPSPATGHSEKTIDGKDATCTEPGLTPGKVCTVCNTETKKQNEINPKGHNFVDGICTACEAEDPSVARTYVFDVQTLCAFGTSDANLGVKLENHALIIENGCTYPSFFTFYMSNKTKIESGKKASFPDGTTYTDALRLNHGGGTSINSTPDDGGDPITKNALMFTIPEGCNTYIKVWWTCGGDGREIGIFDAEGNLVAASHTDDVFTEETEHKGEPGSGKNRPYVSEIALTGSGVFYLGTDSTNALKDGGNILWKVEVTVSPVKNTADLEGDGTESSPIVLPGVGDFVSAFPGGYNPTWHQYTPTESGFLTLSSAMGENAWLKLGANMMTATDNNGSGESITIFVAAGTTYYIGTGDWLEGVMDIPFTLSFEKVTSDPIDPVVGSWGGTHEAMWGSTPYVITIGEDGQGTIVQSAMWGDVTYTISVVIVNGNNVTICSVDPNGYSLNFEFVYDAEAQTLTGGNESMTIIFTPYVPGEEDDTPSESTLNVADDEGNRGNNEVGGSSVDFVYMADTTHTLVLQFGNAIGADVTFTYTINGGDPVAVELGSTVNVELYMGDKLVISAVTDGGYSSINASVAGAGTDNPGEGEGDEPSGDNPGGDTTTPDGSMDNPFVIESFPYNSTASIAGEYGGSVNYVYTTTAEGYVTVTVVATNADYLCINDKSVTELKIPVFANKEYSINIYNGVATDLTVSVSFEESALTADDYRSMINNSGASDATYEWNVNFAQTDDGVYYACVGYSSYPDYTTHYYSYDVTFNADGTVSVTLTGLLDLSAQYMPNEGAEYVIANGYTLLLTLDEWGMYVLSFVE